VDVFWFTSKNHEEEWTITDIFDGVTPRGAPQWSNIRGVRIWPMNRYLELEPFWVFSDPELEKKNLKVT